MIEEKIEQNFIQRPKWYSRFAESNFYPMLLEMGNSEEQINKYQLKRINQSVLLFVGLSVIGWLLLKSVWVIPVALILSGIIFKSKFKKVKGMYNFWKFERQLHFSKFTRLLIPYLKQENGQVSLYSIFNSILNRTTNEADQKSIYRLLNEMSERPNDIQPFLDFAERSSGSDMSILFMSTIYEYQQNSTDISVIEELGRLSSQELMTNIDEIISFKLKRFTFFPTKIVLSTILVILGYAIGVMIYTLKNITL